MSPFIAGAVSAMMEIRAPGGVLAFPNHRRGFQPVHFGHLEVHQD